MIKSLSKMSPEIRDMISEIKYAPKQNSPNRILLYMQDDMQVVGNIKRLLIKLNIILKCHNLYQRRLWQLENPRLYRFICRCIIYTV